jgi:hypothetical protein
MKYNFGITIIFRGLVDDIHLDETDVAKEFWGKQGRVGIVPLIDNQAFNIIPVSLCLSKICLTTLG